MKRAERLRGLYAITPEAADTRALVASAREALAGGAALLQYRAKRAAPGVALEQARLLAAECRLHGALFIVNDALDLALACGADGVHLGRDDMDVAAARARWPQGVIGVSCYASPEAARAARAAGASYVAIGSMFASATKPAAVRAPLAAIERARQAGGLPVCAIGGITPDNAGEAVAAGADMIAVISALFEAQDVRAAARSLSRFFAMPEASRDARAQPRAV
jgi:thiamine-phosphate pyrophosphorylase